MSLHKRHTAESLFSCFEELEILYKNHMHPPVFTVEESKQLRGTLHGAHTKNLFLRDKKKRFWLLTVSESQSVDLKTLKRYLGASGSLSFGYAEYLENYLGVLPGSVTPYSVINDATGTVTMLLDNELLKTDPINAHPLQNDMTVAISPSDLLRFLEEQGHTPHMIDFAELT
jgi:Ala-tRNA(Pro) deacylase